MKKKGLTIIMFIISLFLAFNIWQMILKYDVQSVKNDYFDVINDNKSDLYYGALLAFAYPEIEHRKVKNLDFEIDYAFHDFTNGYIETRFSNAVYDLNNGDKAKYDACRCFAKMYIEKRNGRWVVTKIEEQAGAGFFIYTEEMYSH